ncbi:MAG: hypothetical protein ACI9PP_000277 [Halobacteriales archaeon]|jgi:hypothetical protein
MSLHELSIKDTTKDIDLVVMDEMALRRVNYPAPLAPVGRSLRTRS